MGRDAVVIASGAPVTVRVTLAVRTVLPAVPATVIKYEPTAAPTGTATLIVELPEPGAAIAVGLKATVAPAGSPDALKPMAELKPPDTAVVIVLIPLFPGATEIEPGDAVIVKAEPTVKVWVTGVAAA